MTDAKAERFAKSAHRRFHRFAQRRFLAEQLAMNHPLRNHRSVVGGACYSLDLDIPLGARTHLAGGSRHDQFA